MGNIADFMKDAGALLGSRGFICDSEQIAPWLEDWRGVYKGATLAMAAPASTKELAALVQLCARDKVSIVPQGGNSGMVGGATPDESGQSLLLSLRRMSAIRRIDAASRVVECEAGVVLQHLHEAAALQNMRFPLSLGGKGSATIGGLISTNAGGTQVLRHGSMRAQVLGLEAVLADGRIFNALTPLKKDNRGFDLKQLLIGSEGTLGIVTAATLALSPAIVDRAVIWAGLSSLHDARRLMLQCDAVAGNALEGFEVIPAHSLNAALAYLPDSRAPLGDAHPWHALFELVAEDETAASNLMPWAELILKRAYEDGTIQDATIAANEKQAEDFWLLRESIAPAEKRLGPAVQHDISVAVERMPDFVAFAVPEVERRFPGTQAIAFGHLGDGNVHFHVLAPQGAVQEEWHGKEGQQISSFVYELVTKWGGSISAEHGIGQAKLAEFARLGDPVALDMLRAVKQGLDPDNLLNPGKLVPLARAHTNA